MTLRMKKFLFPDFKRRFLSTLVIVTVLAVIISLGPLALITLAGILVAFLTYEWLGLCKIERRYILLLIVPLIWGAMYQAYEGHVRLSFGLLLACASFGIFLSWFAWHRRFLWGSLALIYFGVSFTALAWMLQAYRNAPTVLIWLIFIVAGSDVGGYIVGSLFKGPKMVPEISPNKTWSGFIGSLIMAVLLGGMGYKLFVFQTPPLHVSVACVVIALVAILGDLTESLIKRYHHVKDAGSWIPGHGGFLDRLDSYLFVIPVVVWMMNVAPDMFSPFVPTFEDWWDARMEDGQS